MPEPEDEKFSEDMQTLDELFKRMAQRGLIVTHGYSDNTKRIAVEFTPEGKEVLLTFYSLEKLIGPLNHHTQRSRRMTWQQP